MNIIGSLLISIIFAIIFLLLIIRYIKSIYNYKTDFRWFIILFRSLTIIFLLLLVIDLRFTWESVQEEGSDMAVIFDVSKSAKLHLYNHNHTLESLKADIDAWSNNQDVEIKYFTFAEKLELMDDFSNNDSLININSTNFSNLSHSEQLKRFDNIILITDGQATTGQSLDQIDFKNFPPFYTVGLGKKELQNDLAVYDVDVKGNYDYADTVQINFKVQSMIGYDLKTSFYIYDSNNDMIYNDIILLEKGKHIKEMKIGINKSELTNYNIIVIDSMKSEINHVNNRAPFLVDVSKRDENILLISGALSGNTSIIKKHLSKQENYKLINCHRYNKSDWSINLEKINYTTIELIVLDDFPLYGEDESIFTDLIEKSYVHNIPLILFQGPSMDMESARIISKKYSSLNPMDADPDIKVPLSSQSLWARRMNLNVEEIQPQNRMLKWIYKGDSLLDFSDGSIFLANDELFYFISSPNLSGIYYNDIINGNMTLSEIIDKIILIAIDGNQGLINMAVDGMLFHLGEKIKMKSTILNIYELSNLDFYYFDTNDTLRIDCNHENINNTIACEHYFDMPGKYVLFSTGELNDGEKIYSNEVEIIIDEIDMEEDNLSLNEQGLLSMSSSTDGAYCPVDSLHSIYKAIDTNLKQVDKIHKISAINSQNYWWIIIILLCVEWYMRKKRGLL